MPDFITARLPVPDSAQEFEKMVNAAADLCWPNSGFQRYGRPGQQQDGVDTYGQFGLGAGIAIQCKNTTHALPFSVVKSEVQKAKNYKHPIARIIVATTQPNDRHLQDETWKFSREIEAELVSESLFGSGKMSLHNWRRIG